MANHDTTTCSSLDSLSMNSDSMTVGNSIIAQSAHHGSEDDNSDHAVFGSALHIPTDVLWPLLFCNTLSRSPKLLYIPTRQEDILLHTHKGRLDGLSMMTAYTVNYDHLPYRLSGPFLLFVISATMAEEDSEKRVASWKFFDSDIRATA